MARHWDYWDEGRIPPHLRRRPRPKAKSPTGGRDIIGADAAVGRTRWRPISTWPRSPGTTPGPMLAYTCKPLAGHRLRPVDRFGHLRLRPRERRARSKHLQAHAKAAVPATTPWYTAIRRPCPAMTNIPSGRPMIRRSPSSRSAAQATSRTRPACSSTTATPPKCSDLTADFDYNATERRRGAATTCIYFIAPIEATHQICRVAPSVGEVEVDSRTRRPRHQRLHDGRRSGSPPRCARSRWPRSSSR